MKEQVLDLALVLKCINGKIDGTPKLTYIYSDQSRGKLAIDKHFENGLPNSILVTDRHSSYFNLNVAGHQLCLAHVLET